MLAAVGVFAVAVGSDPGCAAMLAAAWSLTEIGLLAVALVLVVWAMFWHRPRWLWVLLPLALATATALGFVADLAWGWNFSCAAVA